MVMLGGGADISGTVVVLGGGDRAWRSWRGGPSSERRRSWSSRSPSAVMVRPRQPRESPVQDGPDQGQAGGLAGKTADDLGCSGAGLAEVRSIHPAIVILSRRTWDDRRVFEAAAVVFECADDTAVPPGLAVPAALLGVGA